MKLKTSDVELKKKKNTHTQKNKKKRGKSGDHTRHTSTAFTNSLRATSVSNKQNNNNNKAVIQSCP